MAAYVRELRFWQVPSAASGCAQGTRAKNQGMGGAGVAGCLFFDKESTQNGLKKQLLPRLRT